jgi:hypothetical protein
MEWVLFVSLQWVVNGTPLPPTASQIASFPSEENCRRAAQAIRTEVEAPLPNNIRTYGRVVCFVRNASDSAPASILAPSR